jgi:hypothetical protein
MAGVRAGWVGVAGRGGWLADAIKPMRLSDAAGWPGAQADRNEDIRLNL